MLKAFPELAKAARRPLPDGAEEIGRLDATSRALLANAWATRARSELDASSAFATMLHGIITLDVEPSVRWLAARAVCDELRHSEICRHMAACYGADVPALAPPRRVEQATAGPVVHAIANCAISETIASAFLSRSLDEAQSALSHAVVRELLEDEVDHSRIGWALLAGMDKGEQRALTAVLPQIVRIVRNLWLDAAEKTGDDLPRGHGCLRGTDLLTVVDDAFRELVIPGLSYAGIDPTSVRRELG
ncbi:MAG: hypothetical protein BGO98_34525 [Myxococcales bacterium 68-20]|nr:MAG: hypothetical protein BGO98_34525 [Myxococcales bacterium 68-20]